MAFRPLRGPRLTSPNSDGEKGAVAAVGASPFLPVTIRGEMPGRAMRGSASLTFISAKAPYGALISIMPVAVRAEYCGRYMSSTAAAGWA
ncbi:hypothetical protein EN824_03050 [Mesorhizobium sp. M8A.F.Ca.ET.181.01.1.1]|nr:hypothetical protein EN861_25425 [Mesorhizobium sp. M8A.F.Ca.ET.218.01.1.1]TGS48320.1 hypothetical protein EN825_05080 [Mesorhizobium sp. M8A.F.Ca.ET.182.01.1.1]TGS83390.1 hypothetical protein EN824_03050 [Mesorhizobium sp. M8A.F.Ca.ET.181.01.1.1]TGT16609.1 hypothetical protein EN856_24960 [Mesorhizobium sp. M8A.F.Ca.ET.213.01.1.1]